MRFLGKRIKTKRLAVHIALLALSLVPCTLQLHSQNLVPNPSFELHDTCPALPGFNSKPLHWDRWDQDPEYFHACAGDLGGADTLLDVPWNGFTWQYAHDGEGYVGMTCYESNDFREHVGAQLLQPMTIGQSYHVSYWINLATEGSYWWTRWACNNQGILFTMQEHIWSGNTGASPEFQPRNHAHVNNPVVVTDTAGWTLVSGSFVADSAYQYIVLGNFFEDALTDTVHYVPGPSLAAYYLYDAICVSPTPGACPISTSIQEPIDEPIQLLVSSGGQWLQVVGAAQGTIAWIFDAGGRLVKGFNVDEARSIQDLVEGLYLVRVEGPDMVAWSGKFVVLR